MLRKKEKKPEIPKEIAFEYLKSNFFRVISASGAFGGLSPTGREIHMAIFSERRAIPKKTVHSVSREGKIGEEVIQKREVRGGFIREIEVDLVIDLQTALRIQEWLQDKIQQLVKAHGLQLPAEVTDPPKKANGAGRKRK